MPSSSVDFGRKKIQSLKLKEKLILMRKYAETGTSLLHVVANKKVLIMINTKKPKK